MNNNIIKQHCHQVTELLECFLKVKTKLLIVNVQVNVHLICQPESPSRVS